MGGVRQRYWFISEQKRRFEWRRKSDDVVGGREGNLPNDNERSTLIENENSM